MKTVNVSELEGAALDWATGKAISADVLFEDWGGADPWVVLSDHGSFEWAPFSPSKEWSQAGPLIESHWLMIDIYSNGETEAKAYLQDGSHWTCFGPTPLVAVCRAIVGAHAKQSTVEVPEELLP